MADKITCPYCGKKLEITAALREQIKDKVLKEAEEGLEEEFERRLKREKSRLEKEMADRVGIEIKDLKKQLEEKDKKVEELRKKELDLRQEKRRIEEKEKELELEMERRLDEQRKKIEEGVLKREAEKQRLKDREKDKIIADLKKALEEAQRKAQVGSQQLAGEVLELDLEESLRDAFKDDLIEPVGKGVKGADVRQVVRSPKGFKCGVILWETKRTKNWSDSWILKLKSDLRSEKANIPVIVSSALPKEMGGGFGLKDGVWVVGYSLIMPLAVLLRKNLLEVGYQKAVSSHRGKKSDILYEYITGHEFKQQVEAMVEVYREMEEQIGKEKAAYERMWKLREGQMQRLIKATANVVGSIQGKVGQAAFDIKKLELIESGENEK